MKYVYGPVRSRRLGFSLGVSTVPYKVCSFDCVYCQLKSTPEKSIIRKNYVDEKEILSEIVSFFENKPKDQKVDCITFSGSGEPTLSASLGHLIEEIRNISSLPIVLITNSSMLVKPIVRKQAAKADLVIPSLDAVTQDVFEQIDRPAKGIKISEVIDSLIRFRKQYKGKIWLEVMLVRGVNDSETYLEKIKKTIDRIRPDKVQINSPVRIPAEKWVKPPLAATLKKAKEILGRDCDIIC